MSVFSASMIMGPVLGPVIGGFLAEVGWRWIFWVLTILVCVFPVMLDNSAHPNRTRVA